MKKLLIALLVLLLVWTAAACSVAGEKKDAEQNKTSEPTAAEKETEPEPETEKPTEPSLPFEFTYKGLKLRVDSVEDYAYNAENDSFDPPQGKYVVATCSILEGEEATGSLSGLYDCLKMNGYEPDSIGTSGVMSLKSGQMYVGTETILSFRFDVPEDFDTASPAFTAE